MRIIDNEAVPLLKRCSLAGHATLKSPARVFSDHPLAADMCIDILSDRGALFSTMSPSTCPCMPFPMQQLAYLMSAHSDNCSCHNSPSASHSSMLSLFLAAADNLLRLHLCNAIHLYCVHLQASVLLTLSTRCLCQPKWIWRQATSRAAHMKCTTSGEFYAPPCSPLVQLCSHTHYSCWHQ